jgi:hypothetical protein
MNTASGTESVEGGRSRALDDGQVRHAKRRGVAVDAGNSIAALLDSDRGQGTIREQPLDRYRSGAGTDVPE